MLLDSDVPVRYLGREVWSKRHYLQDALSWMKQERFDLVHAWSASANLYARLPAIVAGVPVIVGGLRGKSGMEGVLPLFNSLMNCRCAGWIVNSRSIGEFARSKMAFMSGCPVCVVKNGFDCKDDGIFRYGERTVYDDRKREVPVIGIVGRLHPVKNHAMFLEMVRRLTIDHVDADYWILGDGPERAAIERTIKQEDLSDRVTLWGMRQDVDVALSRMDLLVLTSHSESCPNAVLEAMRASLPVIATDCTNLEEIIEDGRNGFVVPTDDVDCLVQRVKKVLCCEISRKAMGQRSRAIVCNGFSLEASAHELDKAYRGFVKAVNLTNRKTNRKLNEFIAYSERS
jgi:glycosyltransferase involved in cell wall biosynthesis